MCQKPQGHGWLFRGGQMSVPPVPSQIGRQVLAVRLFYRGSSQCATGALAMKRGSAKGADVVLGGARGARARSTGVCFQIRAGRWTGQVETRSVTIADYVQ